MVRFEKQRQIQRCMNVPALPVKKTFLPVSTALRTAACSLFNFREGRARTGFLLGLAFTWSNTHKLRDLTLVWG